MAACCDLGFVESQAVEPENLTVIGHVGNLLADIYAKNLTHIYILPWCSTPAASLLNSAGDGAQFVRSWCAISGGILSTHKEITHCARLSNLEIFILWTADQAIHIKMVSRSVWSCISQQLLGNIRLVRQEATSVGHTVHCQQQCQTCSTAQKRPDQILHFGFHKNTSFLFLSSKIKLDRLQFIACGIRYCRFETNNHGYSSSRFAEKV